MALPQEPAEKIIAKAKALIEQVQSGLDASADRLRDLDLDPEKVQTLLATQFTAEIQREAQQAFENDMQAIDQEVHENLARAAFSAPVKNSPRRHRTMI